jgi:hypothetical protein
MPLQLVWKTYLYPESGQTLWPLLPLCTGFTLVLSQCGHILQLFLFQGRGVVSARRTSTRFPCLL